MGLLRVGLKGLIMNETDDIVIEEGFAWTWIFYDDIEPFEVTGKYLFFSKDKSALIDLAKKLLLKYKLHSAKTRGDEQTAFVLCIYDKSPRYLKEMVGEYDPLVITYCDWKSEKETMQEHGLG